MRQADEQRAAMTLDLKALIKSSSSALSNDLRLLLSASQRQDLIIHSIATDLTRGFKDVADEVTRATHTVNNRLDLMEERFSSSPVTRRRKPRPQNLPPVHRSGPHSPASVDERCDRYCRCQCHEMTFMHSPPRARNLIGWLMIQYTGTNVFRLGQCTVTSCRSMAKKSVTIAYRPPRWLLDCTMYLCAGWGSLTNEGASLHLWTPRIPDVESKFEVALETEDVGWIIERVRTKELLPTDILDTGVSIMTVGI